jgi:FMN-dependent NADH-azoreductase
MKDILVVTSSPRGQESLSSRLARELVDGLTRSGGARVVHRDLAADPLPHIGAAYVSGRTMDAGARSAEQTAAVALAESLIGEIAAAEVVVVATGMMNFTVPSQIKSWIDHVVWPGVTFDYVDGVPQGKLTGKKVYVIAAAGGIYADGPMSAADHQTPYLLHALGFIGLTDVELIRIEGTVFGPEAAQAAFAEAEGQVASILERAA